MKKTIVLLFFAILLSGCRMISIGYPDGKSVTVVSFGLDTSIGTFAGKNAEGTEIQFSDVKTNPNEVMINKLIDKIPTPSIVPIP